MEKHNGNPFVVLVLLFSFLFSPLVALDGSRNEAPFSRLSAPEIFLTAPALVSSAGQTQKLAQNSRIQASLVRGNARGPSHSFDKLIIVEGTCEPHRSFAVVSRRSRFCRDPRLPSARGFCAFSRPPPIASC
ncbi:MAG: hypothetical protein J5855_04865 [Mailhella sp.]|nr:hypothetical protein [Mailhella sp.]